MAVRLQSEDFDVGAELSGFTGGATDIGAVVSFTGIVRNSEAGDLAAMEIEHYPGMAERAIAAVEAEAMGRWALKACLIIHRHGRLVPGEQIMMVATAAGHRAEAFAAADFLMDYLKSRAPFWKREITTEGPRWVEAKSEDEDALARWS